MWKKIYFDFDNKNFIGFEVLYLSASIALMYLVNNIKLNIAFSLNLWARYSFSPIKRYWNRTKCILRYLVGTNHTSLFYSNKSNFDLVGFAYSRYLSDPHKNRSQTNDLFTSEGIVISWWFKKRTITDTSSNQVEILAIHETSWECVWLRSITQHIRETCGLSPCKNLSTILYENNTSISIRGVKRIVENWTKPQWIRIEPKLKPILMCFSSV